MSIRINLIPLSVIPLSVIPLCGFYCNCYNIIFSSKILFFSLLQYRMTRGSQLIISFIFFKRKKIGKSFFSRIALSGLTFSEKLSQKFDILSFLLFSFWFGDLVQRFTLALPQINHVLLLQNHYCSV
jgi:hypothetical protein